MRRRCVARIRPPRGPGASVSRPSSSWNDATSLGSLRTAGRMLSVPRLSQATERSTSSQLGLCLRAECRACLWLLPALYGAASIKGIRAPRGPCRARRVRPRRWKARYRAPDMVGASRAECRARCSGHGRGTGRRHGRTQAIARGPNSESAATVPGVGWTDDARAPAVPRGRVRSTPQPYPAWDGVASRGPGGAPRVGCRACCRYIHRGRRGIARIRSSSWPCSERAPLIPVWDGTTTTGPFRCPAERLQSTPRSCPTWDGLASLGSGWRSEGRAPIDPRPS